MLINRISGVVVVAAVVLHFGTASSYAANRSFDTGQPRELINQPVCSPAELPDEHNCDFAQRT